MTHVMRSWIARLVVTGAFAVVAGAPAQAQGGRAGQRQQQRQQPGADARGDDEAGVTPGEIQRMFDAYALLQAQEQLRINDDQFSRFLTRFKALQEVRRQALRERARIIVGLRAMVNAPQPDEAQIKEQLNALQELEARAASDLKKAYEAIDQVLDIRQQGKFRVFEEQMERRKLELVMRARQGKQPRPKL